VSQAVQPRKKKRLNRSRDWRGSNIKVPRDQIIENWKNARTF
jgi:hypothetical protein